jgi:ketosteroid isomerase-like protein
MKNMKELIEQFVATTNASDVEAALALFAADAVIEDVSVGETFANTPGVRRYIEQFFVGYHTVSRLESVELIDARHAKAQLDFTGDFGHETGALNVAVNAGGLIESIDAYLD